MGGGVEGDCCDKCAKDEACKIDANGCECWKPSSVSSSDLSKDKTHDLKPVNDIFSDSSMGDVEGDCCDKCAKDEACKIDANGCECWKPSSVQVLIYQRTRH